MMHGFLAFLQAVPVDLHIILQVGGIVLMIGMFYERVKSLRSSQHKGLSEMKEMLNVRIEALEKTFHDRFEKIDERRREDKDHIDKEFSRGERVHTDESRRQHDSIASMRVAIDRLSNEVARLTATRGTGATDLNGSGIQPELRRH